MKKLLYTLLLSLLTSSALFCAQRNAAAMNVPKQLTELAVMRNKVGTLLMSFVDAQGEFQQKTNPLDAFGVLEGLLQNYSLISHNVAVEDFHETVARLVSHHDKGSVTRRWAAHNYIQMIFAEHAVKCGGTAVPPTVAQYFANLSHQELRALAIAIIKKMDGLDLE